MSQSLSRSEPHRPARVLQGLQECGLELWKERLQCYAHLQRAIYEDAVIPAGRYIMLFVFLNKMYKLNFVKLIHF